MPIMTGRVSDQGLAKAIQVAGSQAELARRVGANGRSTVNWWVSRGVLPPDWIIAVEQATGVDRSELRPDLYRREDAAA